MLASNPPLLLPPAASPLHSVLLVAPPGLYTRAIGAVVHSTPSLDLRRVVHTIRQAQEVLRTGVMHALIIDADVSEAEALELIEHVRAAFPCLHLIALTNSLSQQNMFLEAGAHFALLKGFVGDHLVEALACVGDSAHSFCLSKEMA